MIKFNSMEKFDELLKKLNEKEITCTELNWEEVIPEKIWEDGYFDDYKIVDEELDIDKHRWYEISTTVIRIFNKYLGIRHVSNLYSETMVTKDCYETIKFFEMKKIQTVSYESI